MPRIIYSPRYNISGYGIEKWHPFDGKKYGKSWEAIQTRLPVAKQWSIEPKQPASREALARVHTAEHLQQLGTAAYLAKVFETPKAAWVPAMILDQLVLKPMRWATQGTILSLEAALEHGLAINLGGGFHHAKPSCGEGFNVYNDVPIAVADLRSRGLLAPSDVILYVDCDAHQGNGVCHCFLKDRSVKIFDVFNRDIYPVADAIAQARIDHRCPMNYGTGGEEYLLKLQRELPAFLDQLAAAGSQVRLAIYNSGTDVHQDDPLGALALTSAEVLERDVWVVQQLRRRQFPVAMVLGGGYTQQGFELVAQSVLAILAQTQC